MTCPQLVQKFPQISHILWNKKFYYPFTSATCLSLFWITAMQSMHPIHCLNVNFNILLPSTPMFTEWFFPSGLLTKTLYAPLLFFLRATCPAHQMNLYLSTQKIYSEEHTAQRTSLCRLPLLISVSNIFRSWTGWRRKHQYSFEIRIKWRREIFSTSLLEKYFNEYIYFTQYFHLIQR